MAWTNTSTDGRTGIFFISDFAGVQPQLNTASSTNPDLQVSESVSVFTDVKRTVNSKADCSVSNLLVTAGELAWVSIRFQAASSFNASNPASSEYRFPIVQNSSDGSVSYSGDFIIQGMPFGASVVYSFEARFLSADGQYAVDSSDGTTVVAVVHDNVSFDGVDDLVQYAEVTNLKTYGNAGVLSDAGTGASPTVAGTRTLNLVWDDMTTKTTLSSHPHVDGTARNVTTNTLKFTTKYRVYMWIADSGTEPENSYPTTTDTEGTWYFVEETSTPSAAIPCPVGKNFSFWVGFRTESTAVYTDEPPQYSYSATS